MIDEDDGNEYLRRHPAYELSLWQEWVQVVCRRQEIAAPTGREWDRLTKTWHHGKAPLVSVGELVAMRSVQGEST